MKTILKTLILAILFFNTSFAQNKEELKKMSIFISNFIEAGIRDIDIEHIDNEYITDKKELEKLTKELVLFGIWHNSLNNWSRMRDSSNCSNGGMETKYVKESVEKYFGYELDGNFPKTIPLYEGDDSPIKLENNCYPLLDKGGDPTGYAEVKSFENLKDGLVFMQGKTYSYVCGGCDESELSGYFIALAKEKNWKGKKTWELIKLKSISIP